MKIEHVTALQEILEQKESQQLDTMLLDELRKDSPNTELLRLISSILKERDRDLIPEIDDNIRGAWEQYQRQTTPKRTKPKRLNSVLVKAASLVLVVLTLVALLPQKAEAYNFFQRIIAWTENVFSFITPSEEAVPEDYVFHTDNPGLQKVFDMVMELGITVPVVPSWIPEGYELAECEAVQTPANSYLVAIFKCNGSELLYQINIYSDNVTREYYKDGTPVWKEEKDGVIYSIIQNYDVLVAVWSTENIECSIFMDCQEDTLLRILESIYMMEEN